MTVVDTFIDPALAAGVADAIPCEFGDPGECGQAAKWIATMECGCRHFACTPHRQMVVRQMLALCVSLMLHTHSGSFGACTVCAARLTDPTITWDHI